MEVEVEVDDPMTFQHSIMAARRQGLASLQRILQIRRAATVNQCCQIHTHRQSQGDGGQGHGYNQGHDANRSTVWLTGAAAAIATGVIVIGTNRSRLKAEAASTADVGNRIGTLPTYSREEVSGHDDEKKRIWVSYKNGVYDVTDFVSKHPGAKNIMMAAGSSVEPFWSIYPVHNSKETYKLLEQYRIGNLKQEDVLSASNTSDASSSNDPFGNEPRRHAALNVKTQKPFNAETPLALIADSFYTPNDLFYVRNHLPTPEVTADEYELEISGIGVKDVTLTLADIKKFPKHDVVSAIQCGGNRRAEMKARKDLKGLAWTGGAMGNAKWSGARLYDVLKASGLTDEEAAKKVKHIQFEAYDVGADGSPYGASIPVEKGFSPYGDVLLAYEMNGETLPRDHGFPIRVVVPGVVGARNVKWVNRIVVSDVESGSHWQQNDYKGFGPGTDWDTLDYSKAPSIQNMPVTSLITEPENEAKVKVGADGTFKIKGYAWAGSGNRIIRIDLTADGGKTWFEGTIDQQDNAREPHHYGWTLWSASVKVPKNGAKDMEIWSKAVDSAYNVQPESFENIWNVRGLLSNAYAKLNVKF